jgi:sulfonate transport system permease protein
MSLRSFAEQRFGGIAQWLLPAAIIVVWQSAVSSGLLSTHILPAPTDVVEAGWRLLRKVRNIPHLALIPLVILWFGIDETAKIFLVALGVFFPIYINTQHGIRSVDPQLVEMGRVYGMTPWELFWRVILQGALPSIFVGVRFGLGIMWLTLIVAETIAASSGIGYMAMQAREFLLLDVVVLSILIYALLGKAADSAARVLERVCLAWHPAFQKSASL